MNKVSLCVLWCDDVQDLQHIKENTIINRSIIVVAVTSQPVFDLRECFFDGVEVGGVGWQVFNTDSCNTAVSTILRSTVIRLTKAIRKL